METALYVGGILAIGAIYVIISTTMWSKKRKRLLEAGKITERPGNFHKLAYKFTSSIGNISTIISAIDPELLREMRLKVKPNYQEDCVLFRMSRRLFEAELVLMGQADDKYLYTFAFLRWKEASGLMEGGENANALLTAVEKAFVKLDPYASVESAAAAYKEKFF